MFRINAPSSTETVAVGYLIPQTNLSSVTYTNTFPLHSQRSDTKNGENSFCVSQCYTAFSTHHFLQLFGLPHPKPSIGEISSPLPIVLCHLHYLLCSLFFQQFPSKKVSICIVFDVCKVIFCHHFALYCPVISEKMQSVNLSFPQTDLRFLLLTLLTRNVQLVTEKKSENFCLFDFFCSD